MRIPDFKVPKDFEVKHTHASVVLGSYPLPTKFERAVELGCGNAVASVIMALLNPFLSKITAVDVDKKACENASAFVDINGLSKKIEVLNVEVTELPKVLGYESIDFVFFNPPFHISGKVSEDERRFLERNENAFESFALSTSKVLKNRGYFRMITSPVNLLIEFETLRKYNLTPKVLIPAYGKRNVDSKLILIEGIKNGKKMGFKIKPPLFLDSLS
ncbi:tRNA1(Val) (adenine(37)-N6)-methyltransferase [Mesoaciditoga lauensis]|uniref:tRNA1(Val) (adenine(37)-N6)-methyltransferase n=1 Tax=Mesoaciditoga lauensis TaxID=1495039 RepID=UPI00056A44C7|nr:methyltransferase [Mesoaciditoga lauensis]